jgi:hypothetical protein
LISGLVKKGRGPGFTRARFCPPGPPGPGYPFRSEYYSVSTSIAVISISIS